MYEDNVKSVGQEALERTGAVVEITRQAKANNDTARNVSQRLQDLRLRLMGPHEIDNQMKAERDAPTPVRSEIEDLAAELETSRRIQEEILNNLAEIERL